MLSSNACLVRNQLISQGLFPSVCVVELCGAWTNRREDWLSNAMRLQRIQIFQESFGKTIERIVTSFQGTPHNGFGLILWNTSPFITVETEELIYPFPSLVSFIRFAIFASTDILTQRWLSSVEPLVSSLASPSSPFGTDLLPSSPCRQNIEQPPNYYLWVYLVLESNISSTWKLSSPPCKTSLAVI